MAAVSSQPGNGSLIGSHDPAVGEIDTLHYYNSSSTTSNESSRYIHFGIEQTEYIFDRGDVRAVFLVLYTIVFCSCFFGNLMVILVVTLHWRMRSITNFCLANLAFADLCVGIFCVYQNIVTYLMDSWIFGEFMCKMYHFINSLSTTASVLILVVICIERYLAIIHPMTCKQMLTLNRLRITIVCVWILSAVISSPRFYYFSTISYPLHNGQYETLCLPNRTKYDSKLLDMISMLVLFLIPLGIISVLYTHIGVVLWKTSNTKMSTVSTSMENSSSSCSCYRETENHTIQSINFTLPPVKTVKNQRANRPTSLNGIFSHSNTNNINGNQCNKNYSGKKSFLHLSSSPLICIKCGNKPKKLCQNTQNGTNGNAGTIVENHENLMHEKVPTHFKGNDAEVEEVNNSPISTTCCVGVKSRCLNHIHKQGSNKTVTFSTPPSPFSNRNCSDDFDTTNLKTNPIVLVKFEKKQKSNKWGRKSQCTILMNNENLQSNSCDTKINPLIKNHVTTPTYLETTFNDNHSQCSCEDAIRESSPYQRPVFNHVSSFLKTPASNLLVNPQPKKLRRLRVLKSSKYGTGALQSRRRIVKMLIVVVLAFAICHLPLHARKIWQYNSSNYQGGSVFSQVFTPFTFLIMYVNSGINPILYAFMSKKFRMSFRDLLCCKMRQSLRVSRNASVKSTHVVALSQAGCKL